jgi:hypothetical protein
VADRRHSAHDTSLRRRRSAGNAFEGTRDPMVLALLADVAEVACVGTVYFGMERPLHMTGAHSLFRIRDTIDGHTRYFT